MGRGDQLVGQLLSPLVVASCSCFRCFWRENTREMLPQVPVCLGAPRGRSHRSRPSREARCSADREMAALRSGTVSGDPSGEQRWPTGAAEHTAASAHPPLPAPPRPRGGTRPTTGSWEFVRSVQPDRVGRRVVVNSFWTFL